MRAEFEEWAEKKCMSLARVNWKDGSLSDYAFTATFEAWKVWQAAYAAGRASLQREKEEWSKVVNKAWIDSAKKLVDDEPEAQGDK